MEAQIRQLDHPAYQERIRAQAALVRQGKNVLVPVTDALAAPKTDPIAKRHLVWVVDALAGGTPEATYRLLELLKSNVARPAGPGGPCAWANGMCRSQREPLESLLQDREPSVRLQATIALGRIGQAQAIPALLPVLADAGRLPRLLGSPGAHANRRLEGGRQGTGFAPIPKSAPGVLLAMDRVYEVDAADALAVFATSSKHPVEERTRAIAYLAEVHRKAPPWNGHWWGTQPAARSRRPRPSPGRGRRE